MSRLKDMEEKSLLQTEFTFGIELETKLHLCVELNKYLEREVIWESKDKHLVATSEVYNNFPNSCEYNIELATDVYKYDHIVDFLREDDKKDKLNDVADNIEEFKKDYLEGNDAIRKHEKYTKEFIEERNTNSLNPNLYKDCSLSSLVTFDDEKENKEDKYDTYDTYEDFDLSKEIYAMPQLTIGINYAFFVPLLKKLEEVTLVRNSSYQTYIKQIFLFFDRLMNIVKIYCGKKIPNILNRDMGDISFSVFKGFIFLLIYTSYIILLPTFNEKSYLKARFYFKPRSNYAVSYSYLIKDYPIITEYTNLLFEAICMYVSRNNSDYPNKPFQKVLINGKEVLNYMTDSYIKPYFKNLKSLEDKALIEGIDRSIFICMLYFLTVILEPSKYQEEYIKINFCKNAIQTVDNNRNYCVIKNGYFFKKQMTYIDTDDDSETNMELDHGMLKAFKDENLIKDYEYIQVGDLPYIKQPPPQLVYNKETNKLCANDRVEIFELIGINSNIVFEIRDPNIFIKKNRGNNINLSIDYMKQIFVELKLTIIDYLGINPTFSFKPQKTLKRKSLGKSKRKSLGKSKRKSLGKSKRKSLGKSKRKSLGKSKRKSVGKSKRKSVGKSKRKSVRKSKRKSVGKSKRKSVRKSKRKNS